MARRCRIITCPTPAKAGQLMCRGHWFKVPKPLRTAINAAWRSRDLKTYASNVREAERLILEEERSDG